MKQIIKAFLFSIIFGLKINIIDKKVEFYQNRDFTLIESPKYLKQLINNKENGFTKVLTGNRRCGKSFLIKIYYDYFLKAFQKNTVFESIEPEFTLKNYSSIII